MFLQLVPFFPTDNQVTRLRFKIKQSKGIAHTAVKLIAVTLSYYQSNKCLFLPNFSYC